MCYLSVIAWRMDVLYELREIVFDEVHTSSNISELEPNKPFLVWELETSQDEVAVRLAVDTIKKSLEKGYDESEYTLRRKSEDIWEPVKLPEVRLVSFEGGFMGYFRKPVFEVVWN